MSRSIEVVCWIYVFCCPILCRFYRFDYEKTNPEAHVQRQIVVIIINTVQITDLNGKKEDEEKKSEQQKLDSKPKSRFNNYFKLIFFQLVGIQNFVIDHLCLPYFFFIFFDCLLFNWPFFSVCVSY